MRRTLGFVLGVAAAAMITSSAAANIEKHIVFKPDVPIPIPDNQAGGVRVEIFIPNQPLFIKNLRISLVIEHSWQGDISVFMAHKDSGLGGYLINRSGSSIWGGDSTLGYDADNFGDPLNNDPLILDDAAPVSINLYAGPDSGFGTGINNYKGPAQPTDPLAIYNGDSVGGVWSFIFADHASGDVGSVYHIDLWFELVPAPGAFALLGLAGLVVGRRRRR